MKKVLLIIAGLFVFSGTALAHSPQEMILSYDMTGKVLEVDLTHISRDHLRHYIRKIVVMVNGVETAMERYRQQVSPAMVTKKIPLTAGPGDRISVTVYCSEGGTKTDTITVAEQPGRAPTSQAATVSP